MPENPIVHRKRHSKIAQLLVALFFMVAGAFFCLIGIKEIQLGQKSSQWPVTEGRIIESYVERQRNSKIGSSSTNKETKYSAEVYYEYQVGGVTYSGNRIAFSGSRSSKNPMYPRLLVNRYPTGKEVPVSYQPSSPEICVLEPGLSSSTWIAPGIGVFIILIGLFAMIAKPRQSTPKTALQ